MIEWPDLLIDAIARRRCVLFLGSGISANAKNIDGKKPPTWAEFLKTVMYITDELPRLHDKTATQKRCLSHSGTTTATLPI